MKCENCGKNEVNFVFHSNINGKVEEKHLCQECAGKLGYAKRLQESYAGMNSLFRRSFAPMFSPMGLLSGGYADPFEGLFGGSLLSDGFFNDFFTFPGLESGEANTATEEKTERQDTLGSAEERKQLCRERELNALRAEMQQAIASENFERAAQLRDQIRAKEKEH